MKRIIIALSLLFGLGMMTNNILAQESAKTIFGVNAGLNFSRTPAEEEMNLDSKTGFHVGASVEYRLVNSRPVYLETGIQFTQKGGKFSSFVKATANYLEVPIMVNYKFYSPFGIHFYPSIGVYGSYGIGGKVKFGFDNEVEPIFGDEGYYKRLDFGVRLGMSAQWQQIVFGVGYEHGVINISGPDENAKTRNIYISIGYKF